MRSFANKALPANERNIAPCEEEPKRVTISRRGSPVVRLIQFFQPSAQERNTLHDARSASHSGLQAVRRDPGTQRRGGRARTGTTAPTARAEWGRQDHVDPCRSRAGAAG